MTGGLASPELVRLVAPMLAVGSGGEEAAAMSSSRWMGGGEVVVVAAMSAVVPKAASRAVGPVCRHGSSTSAAPFPFSFPSLTAHRSVSAACAALRARTRSQYSLLACSAVLLGCLLLGACCGGSGVSERCHIVLAPANGNSPNTLLPFAGVVKGGSNSRFGLPSGSRFEFLSSKLPKSFMEDDVVGLLADDEDVGR